MRSWLNITELITSAVGCSEVLSASCVFISPAEVELNEPKWKFKVADKTLSYSDLERRKQKLDKLKEKHKDIKLNSLMIYDFKI